MVNGAAKQCSNALKYVKKSLQKVAKKLDLVYGGGSIGLMGLVSQVVYPGGGHLHRSTPTAGLPLRDFLNIAQSYNLLCIKSLHSIKNSQIYGNAIQSRVAPNA
ncbi:hypothetical protein LguiB_018277 [Lonicera macranthoides]